MLFGRACKTITMRRTVRYYSGDGTPTVKLVTKKDEKREQFWLWFLERESKESE